MGHRFHNPWPGSRPRGLLAAARWGLARLLTRLPADPPASAFPLAVPSFAVPHGPAGQVSVTWIGHSTLLLQLGDRNVLTDPIWSRRASPVQWAGPARLVPPAVALEDLPPIDLVVLSHNHYDHLDVATVRAVVARWPSASWIVPSGLAAFVRGLGVGDAVELGWWGRARRAGLDVTSTPAQHFSHRRPGDRNRTLWCGWMIEGEGGRVYFAGDTGYHSAFAEIARRCGAPDVACLPVGAYEPRWFMRPMHMNPEDALQAFADLLAGDPRGRTVMVPIHWGTFRLTDEALDEPPARTRRAWEARGLPPERLWLLAHGETRRLLSEEAGTDHARHPVPSRSARASAKEYDRVESAQPLQTLAPDSAGPARDDRPGVLGG